MKNLVYLISLFFLISCGEKEFSQMNNEEKKDVLKQNVIRYVNNKKDSVIFKNYFFLLEQSNKTKPCPDKEFELIHILINEELSVELSLGILGTHKYLNTDDKLGELDVYGISFNTNNHTGKIEGCYAYATFVRWSNDEIGARQSLGSDIVQYKDTIVNIKDRYSSIKLLEKLNEFYESEMKNRQIKNKHKCN